MFGWFRKYIRKIEIFGVGVEFNPPTDTPQEQQPLAPVNQDMLKSARVEKTARLPGKQIIDSSQELGEDATITDEKYWRATYPGAYECACWYRDLLEKFSERVTPNFRKTMITLYVDGTVRAAIFPKKGDAAVISIEKLSEADITEVGMDLEREAIAVTRKGNLLRFNANLQQLKEKSSIHESIAKRLCKKCGH